MVNWKRRLGAAGVIAAAVAMTRFTRYEIVEESMQPALTAGDWVLGVRHPERLEKAAVGGDSLDTPDGRRTVGPDEVWILGDDPAAGSVDSRHFGPVGRASIRAKLVWRYRPLPVTRIPAL